MVIEIERKFLVQDDGWRTDNCVRVRQGYLSRRKERTIRVRTSAQKAFLSIKSGDHSISRAEFEYEIPVTDAEQLLELCDGTRIEKTRYYVMHAGMTWEVDEFHAANTGLVIAEIELQTEDQSFEKPPWLGREVTGDPRYYNANLVVNPYSTWKK